MTRLSHHGWNCLVPAQRLGKTSPDFQRQGKFKPCTYVQTWKWSFQSQLDLVRVQLKWTSETKLLFCFPSYFVTSRLSKSISSIHSYEFLNRSCIVPHVFSGWTENYFSSKWKVYFFSQGTNIDYLPLVKMGRIHRVWSNNKNTFPTCEWTVSPAASLFLNSFERKQQ